MTDRTGAVYAKNDIELLWVLWPTMMKTRYETYVNDCTNAVYIEKEIEL